VLLASLLTVACSKELKPTKHGVYVVSGETLTELVPLNIDTDFTPEGFAVNYFSANPALTLKNTDYFILYGDYKPYGVRVFLRGINRWEEDGSKGEITGLFEESGYRGEKQMYRSRLRKPLPAGTYVLDVVKGGAYVRFSFIVEY
jgi:hypothetical protein